MKNAMGPEIRYCVYVLDTALGQNFLSHHHAYETLAEARETADYLAKNGNLQGEIYREIDGQDEILGCYRF